MTRESGREIKKPHEAGEMATLETELTTDPHRVGYKDGGEFKPLDEVLRLLMSKLKTNAGLEDPDTPRIVVGCGRESVYREEVTDIIGGGRMWKAKLVSLKRSGTTGIAQVDLIKGEQVVRETIKFQSPGDDVIRKMARQLARNLDEVDKYTTQEEAKVGQELDIREDPLSVEDFE